MEKPRTPLAIAATSEAYKKHSRAYLPILIVALLPILASLSSWGAYDFEGVTLAEMLAETGNEPPGIDATLGAGSYRLDVWHTAAPFFSARVPNWFVMVAAGLIAIIAAFGWREWQTPYYSIAVISCYGGLHSGYWIYLLLASPALRPEIGPFIALAGFGLVLIPWFKLPPALRN